MSEKPLSQFEQLLQAGEKKKLQRAEEAKRQQGLTHVSEITPDVAVPDSTAADQPVPMVPRNDGVPMVPMVPMVPADVPTKTPSVPMVPMDSARNPRNPSVPMVPRNTSKAARSRSARALGQLNVAIPVEMIDALRDMARDEGRSVGDIIEELLFSRLGSRIAGAAVPRNSRNVSNLMIDDDADCANALNIIDHQYRQILGTGLNAKDPDAITQFVREHGVPDEAAVQIGIITTLFRTTETSFSSVRYFFNEIRKAMAMPEDHRKTMAASRMWRWKREGKGSR